jgi:hypothetical protein
VTLTAEEKARVKERKALDAQAPTLRRLRDEAIANIGWVAGNAYGHPIWPEVEPFIGPGGTYYEILLRTGIPGSDPEIEASLNVQRYREAFDRGKAATFNEAEGASRLERINEVVAECRTFCRKLRIRAPAHTPGALRLVPYLSDAAVYTSGRVERPGISHQLSQSQSDQRPPGQRPAPAPMTKPSLDPPDTIAMCSRRVAR